MPEKLLWLEHAYKTLKDASWLRILTPLLLFATTYLIGILLLLIFGRRRPDLLDNNGKLAGWILKPLEWTPRLGGGILFSTYNQDLSTRIEEEKQIRRKALRLACDDTQ